MKLNYYPETDSLYIDLSERPSVETREISEGVQLDYDADGNSWVSTSTMRGRRFAWRNWSSAGFLRRSKR